MNTTNRAALLCVVGLFSSVFWSTHANAASAGNVSGLVTITDGRDNPYLQAGFLSGSPTGARNPGIGGSTAKPFREGLVRLKIDGITQTIYRYVRTKTSGSYNISWSSPFDAISVEVAALAHSPVESGTFTSVPEAQFRVAAIGSSEIVLRSKKFTSGFEGTLSVDLACSDSEAGKAYLTAREVVELWVNQGAVDPGGTAATQVRRVSININDASESPTGHWGVTPSDEQIYLSPATTRFSWVVAHELGHSFAWRALRIELSAVSLGDYGWFDATLTWNEWSDEWQKVAFHDAMAHLNMSLWMWQRAANPPVSEVVLSATSRTSDPRIPCSSANGCNIEVASSCGPGGAATRDRRVICVLRALWDLVDNPTTDDDGLLNRDMSDVFDTLDRYPFCTTNRCNAESWPWDNFLPDYADGNNWKDFKYHWINENGSSAVVGAIEVANGLENSYDL